MKSIQFPIIRLLAAIAAFSLNPHACAGTFPEGFSVLAPSVSPDGRYGVLVPDEAHYKPGSTQNQLVEIATGRVIAVIDAETGMERMNHGGAVAAWSKDGSVLHWMVGGKWFPRAKALIKMKEGAVLWQTNVLKTAQTEILAHARKAKPANYAAAMEKNKENGPAYPDGFTVDVVSSADGKKTTIPFPLKVTLTANPKGFEDFPKGAELEAEMTATIDADGKFRVLTFAVVAPK